MAEWAQQNRTYPVSHARPGRRDPYYTPYGIAVGEFFESPEYETCVLITGTQSGKTESILDAMGWRLATAPRPQLYVGPSADFLKDQFEPRLMRLFDEAPRLAALVGRGKKNKKTRKIVAGVPVRLAWAGSETSLSSDQAGDVYIDEFDKMINYRKGVGDAYGLAKARADTYQDRKIIVTSTPKRGLVAIETDPMTGLDFWKVAAAADINSPIWTMWQQGTRHHWAWRCPHCRSWFIPRMSLLRYPDGATPTHARFNTWLECPSGNGCVIDESDKEGMNAEGCYIAPGMLIDDRGEVLEAEGERNTMLSLWVSGLASPFLSWGERVQEVLVAEGTADAEARQQARNKTGELWAPTGGDVPEWEEILNQRESYHGVPPGVIFLVMGVDVQKGRLVYVIRGFGGRSSSWKIEHGEIWGDTSQREVWNELAVKLSRPIGGLLIRMAFIDSGFRPGKKITMPLNRVYEFCRAHKRNVFATKGSSHSMLKPLIKGRAEVTRRGEIDKYGLELIRLDPGHWKGWVHERIVWPKEQPGAWHINVTPDGHVGKIAAQKLDEDYARQLVAEAAIINAKGDTEWLERSRENHYLDAEALCAAAGFMLNAHNIPKNARRKLIERGDAPPLAPVEIVDPVVETAQSVAQATKPTPPIVPAVLKPPAPRFNRFAAAGARLNR